MSIKKIESLTKEELQEMTLEQLTELKDGLKSERAKAEGSIEQLDKEKLKIQEEIKALGYSTDVKKLEEEITKNEEEQKKQKEKIANMFLQIKTNVKAN